MEIINQCMICYETNENELFLTKCCRQSICRLCLMRLNLNDISNNIIYKCPNCRNINNSFIMKINTYSKFKEACIYRFKKGIKAIKNKFIPSSKVRVV